MTNVKTPSDRRRSTRVPLRVSIQVIGSEPPLECEAETIVVNLHGALVKTPIPLPVGASVVISVYLTGKSAAATVRDVSGDGHQCAGIELQHPRNVWGVSLPPDDWCED